MFLLKVFVSPLVMLFLSFDEWRREVRMQINMTGQIGVIEGYLRVKYNSNAIRVENYEEVGLGVGLEVEGDTHAIHTGLEPNAGDPNTPTLVPLFGESAQQFGDVNFVIYVPASFDERTIELIMIDVERYKQALIKYKIIQG